jgi:integrase
MASRDGLIKTETRGIFYREHSSRKHGVHKDRQWVVRQTLGGETRLSTFGWSSLAKQHRGTDNDGDKIEYSVKSFGDACNKAELYRDNYQWNTMNPEMPPRPVCKQDEIDAARLLAEQIAHKEKTDAFKNTPFGAFFEKTYLPQQKTNGKKSIKREEALFTYHIEPVLGKMTFAEIQPLHLERIKKNMLTAGQAPRSIEYALAVVRQVWAQAIRDGLTDRANPAKDVKKPKVNNQRGRFFTPEEEARLLAELAKRSPITHDMAVMSLDTGARWSELAKLKWPQVNIEAETVRLIDTKAGDDRTAHLATRRVLDMLKRRKGEADRAPADKKSPYVFPDRDGSEQQQVNRVCYRTIKDLKLNDGVDRKHRLSFHSFRHTCASRLAMAGVPLYTIKEILGHHTITTTERYAHLLPSAMKEALTTLDQDSAGLG